MVRARDPSTYLKDIALLEAACRDEPTNVRNVFYLAQSYRDAGRLSESKTTYQRRAAMGGWDEELWYSLFQVAVLSERLGEPPQQVSAAYLAAFNARPSRAESLVELARFHRLRGEHGLAYLYAKHASEMTQPSDRLFIDQATYTWRALDEVGNKAGELTLTPVTLIARIAALVPPPRAHQHRHFGVLAPNSPLRAAVVAMKATHAPTAQAPPVQPAQTAATQQRRGGLRSHLHRRLRPSPSRPSAHRRTTCGRC